MKFKNPLSIYIIWHPNYEEGNQIAENLYSLFCRDYSKPLVTSLGIPVYFRCTNFKGTNCPKNIDFNESQYNAIVPLICDDVVLDQDYKTYLENLLIECETNGSNHRIYPVALSKGAFNISNTFAKINFVRPDQLVDGIDLKQLSQSLLHEFCRLLMHEKKAVDEKESLVYAKPPIKLFISHSKHDDTKQEAIRFRDYINSQTQLKTFFDANDIALGYDFGQEIKRFVNESALVVFQSDSYSDREWCRIELITAKRNGCPAVIVNAIEKGEKRTFPYMGNYPSIRLDNNFEAIISLTLEQVLNNLYTRKLIDNQTDLYGIEADHILTSHPELFNFLQLKKITAKNEKEFRLIIYPDPPLGSEEMQLLNELDETFHFITPIMLPSITL